MDTKAVIDCTRRWIAAMVIDLDLCPFARRVFEGDKVRYFVSFAEDEKALLRDLDSELKSLAKTPIERIETTLIIHPCVFTGFLDYNDFLDAAERRIERLKLGGVIQIASFHPDYQFAGIEPDSVENYTNRSPYPMLHLLREESISAVAGGLRDLGDIPRLNIATLKRLGREKVLEKLRDISGGV